MDPATIRTRVRLRRDGIDIAALGNDPMQGFAQWQQEGQPEAPAGGAARPPSCAMASTDRSGQPWVRQMDVVTVDHGFVFLTHGHSRKMQEMDQTGQAALGFSWPDIGRQVTVRGEMEQLSPEESDVLFQHLPRGIQLVAATTRQDEVLQDRNVMEAALRQRVSELGDAPVPRPDNWVGLRIVPLEMEFWQQRLQDLQDRIHFLRVSTNAPWQQQRLSP